MMNGVEHILRPARDDRDFARCKAFLRSRGLSSADAAMAVDLGRNLLRLPDQRISAAGVVSYLGDQVGSADHQLDPKKTYRLLRPPEALERAAKTAVFELPLLDGHPDFDTDTADDAELAEFRIGNLGKVKWDGCYLLASITVTKPSAIAAILSGRRRAWSIGYLRKTDMTAGDWNGEQYDGVIAGIELTHVSLVEVSRAGQATRISFPNAGENR